MVLSRAGWQPLRLGTSAETDTLNKEQQQAKTGRCTRFPTLDPQDKIVVL